jgi:hypothetical protein
MVVDRENTDAARINAHYLLFSLCERAEPGAGAPTRTQKTGILNSISLRTSQPQGEVPAQPDGGEGDVLQRRAGGLLGLRVHDAEPAGTVQGTALRSRNHRLVRTLVSPVRA